MAWFNADDKMHSHPKPRKAGLEAMGLWLVCGTYSVESKRPGFVPADVVADYPGGRAAARRLVKAELWVGVPGGWEFLHEEEFWTFRYSRIPIPPALRSAVHDRDGWACLHCGSSEDLALDHIWPHSKGGSDTYENLQTLCRSCNSKKGARTHGPG